MSCNKICYQIASLSLFRVDSNTLYWYNSDIKNSACYTEKKSQRSLNYKIVFCHWRQSNIFSWGMPKEVKLKTTNRPLFKLTWNKPFCSLNKKHNEKNKKIKLMNSARWRWPEIYDFCSPKGFSTRLKKYSLKVFDKNLLLNWNTQRYTRINFTTSTLWHITISIELVPLDKDPELMKLKHI